MEIVERFVNSFMFWAAWIVIPLIMEIIPAVGSFFILLKRKYAAKKVTKPILYPEISIIVPVYNSENTLGACIRSINDCDYPNNKIRIFLVNNHGKDNSFSVYTRCQEEYPDLIMQWLNAEQGKSRALNLALYNSEGKYIIHIDSDGVLEKSALTNMVDRFELDSSINCMTGAILIEPDLIEEYPKGMPRLLRRMEFMEYAQAFLAGRNYASDIDAIYTVSGAFSAFRKSAILKSRLYNTETLAEDTQITFQMRYLQGERIYMSEDSIFFVDPIENVDKLYTQRQRWQRGSLEVSKMFIGDKMKTRHLFSDVAVRTLMYDHTFAFPRIIWYLALLCLVFIGYSGKTVILATIVLFGLYTVCGYLYFISTVGFLDKFSEIQKYYKKLWWVVPLLPLFNLMVFFIRFAGIINSINTGSAWKTRTLSEEAQGFREVVREDVKKAKERILKIHNMANGDPKEIYAPKEPQEKMKGSFFGYFISVFVLVFGLTLAIVCHWSSTTYSVQLQEIVNTLLGPLTGTGGDMLEAGLKACVPPVIGVIVTIAIIVFLDRRHIKKIYKSEEGIKKQKKIKRTILFHRGMALLALITLVISLAYSNYCYNVVGYVTSQITKSSFYEKYYVDPNEVAITADGETKNLIYIYVESLETTYASDKEGGYQSFNYIPELTKLAKDNTSFTGQNQLGGFYPCYGATWTMGAMYTSTSGVPYDLPVKDTSMTEQKQYASGLTTLGDILEKQGYQNEFLCGSDAEFGGRKLYLSQHGNYKMFDYYEAIEKKYIPADYFKWWGFEDQKLFEIAKDEATRLYETGKPFNLTMLTVDTHATDGYICDICGNDYSEKTANVVKCTDKQVAEFVKWCQKQPFYENTTIVITGDHPRMDTSLVDDARWYDRTVYNCFINASNAEKVVKNNRETVIFDVFPTTLAAMGFQIEGDKLGLGTNLLSGQRTLVETLGIGVLEEELQKHSDFYVEHFAPELLGIEN